MSMYGKEFKEDCKEIADRLEMYVNLIEVFVDSNSIKDSSIEDVRKMIKKLRKGDEEERLKIIDYDNYMTAKENGTLFINKKDDCIYSGWNL